MGVFFVFFLLRLVLRNTWVAAAALIALDVCLNLAAGATLFTIVYFALLSCVALWIMIRFGILPLTLAFLSGRTGQAPLTSDLSAWYADKGLIIVALVLALAVWSFRNALGGRKVLKGDFLEP